MIARIGFGLALGTCVFAVAATPASARSISVHVDHFRNGGMIPPKYTFCVATPKSHMGAGLDINPRISWSAGPPGTQSYAILLSDTDSPAEHRDRMNKEGVTLSASVKRRTFYHWVLVDIPSNIRTANRRHHHR